MDMISCMGVVSEWCSLGTVILLPRDHRSAIRYNDAAHIEITLEVGDLEILFAPYEWMTCWRRG